MLDQATAKKVSLLARLRLTDEELQLITSQLGVIVEYIDQLSQLDTESVEPMAHAVELTNVFRDDMVQPSLDRDDVLANAPQADEEFYRVPAVLGD